MVARVLIAGGNGPNGAALKVSLPGFDVLTAGPSQLAFDANWQRRTVYRRAHGVVMTGGSLRVSFGETLPRPPQVYFGYGLSQFAPQGTQSGYVAWESRPGHTGYIDYYYAASFTDHVDFVSMRTTPVYLNYVIFRT